MTATDLLALPGDTDLDSDVTGLTVASVIATDDQELLIHLTGGEGWWTGCSYSSDVEMNIRGHFPNTPPDLFAAFTARLTRWRNTHVPIRVCGAPGRIYTLIDNGGAFVPFPRRVHPDWL